MLVVAAGILVLVVTLGGSDGPAAGSPDAVTDDLAAAVQAHDAARVSALSCVSPRARVIREVGGVLDRTTSAQRDGSADVRGDVAVNRIKLDVDQRHLLPGPSGAATSTSNASVIATVALQRVAGKWCVGAFAVALPTH